MEHIELWACAPECLRIASPSVDELPSGQSTDGEGS